MVIGERRFSDERKVKVREVEVKVAPVYLKEKKVTRRPLVKKRRRSLVRVKRVGKNVTAATIKEAFRA